MPLSAPISLAGGDRMGCRGVTKYPPVLNRITRWNNEQFVEVRRTRLRVSLRSLATPRQAAGFARLI